MIATATRGGFTVSMAFQAPKRDSAGPAAGTDLAHDGVAGEGFTSVQGHGSQCNRGGVAGARTVRAWLYPGCPTLLRRGGGCPVEGVLCRAGPGSAATITR